MKQLLYTLVMLIARIHDWILLLNDRFEVQFSDKELHFWVIGLLGLGIFLLVHPLFRKLAEKNRIRSISWIYTFTIIVVVTFAIEIGQYVTGTGQMEFADIASGLLGFFAIFAIYAAIYGIKRLFLRLKDKWKKPKETT